MFYVLIKMYEHQSYCNVLDAAGENSWIKVIKKILIQVLVFGFFFVVHVCYNIRHQTIK